MSLSISAACLMCHFNRHMKRAQALGDSQTGLEFGKELMRMYLAAPEGVSSPWFSPQVAQLFQKYYGVSEDPYKEEKHLANTFIMERFEQIQTVVQQAQDPVFAGLQFSILGNYLDFSALQGNVSFEKMEQMLKEALQMQLDMAVYEEMKADLAKGKKLLYLTDNAGEIGFDRIFAEVIHEAFPHLEITFCVRGGPAMNDALRADAELVGIPFPVIDNGNRVAGTQIDQLSEEAKTALETADVIIAKGQGNIETMYGCGLNVYYAFLIKCARFVQEFGQPKLSPMLVREKA